MQEFTFGMLTYNQEDYVIGHLESIKYQILNFGKDIKVYFVLSDDASKDNTVKYVEMWTEANKELFAGIKIVVKESNSGIVPNYLTMLSNIHTSHYKILAGDDLYYKNNVFELVQKGDFILTPMICFDKEQIIHDKKRYNYKTLLFHQENGNLKEYLVKRLKYSNCIDAPGVFLNYDLLDNELFSELKKYRWIEDVPMWNYLLNLEKVDVKLLQEPYVLYRSEVGISNNKNHSAHNRFKDDLNLLDKNIHTDKKMYPKIINPFKFKYKLERATVKYYCDKNNTALVEFSKKIYLNELEAKMYLSLIMTKVDEWKDKYFQ
ncbi:MAG: glycosyltransferase [Phascolarctobacterium sp.]|nr:glycosyltransferase [Phascolarctobacterium sp.]